MVALLSRKKSQPVGFGARLRELRVAAGLTQKQLGDRLTPAMAYQNIAKLERGAVNPSWERVVELAEALGVTPNDFLDREG